MRRTERNSIMQCQRVPYVHAETIRIIVPAMYELPSMKFVEEEIDEIGEHAIRILNSPFSQRVILVEK